MSLVSTFIADFRARFVRMEQELRESVDHPPVSDTSDVWCRNTNAEIELAADQLETAAVKLRMLKVLVQVKEPLTLLETELLFCALMRGRCWPR